MASTRGIVSYLADPAQGVIATDAWVADMKALGVEQVRARIYADPHNHIPLDLYQRALAPYRRAGMPVVGVLDNQFNQPWIEGVAARVMYPNEALGYRGNRRQNRWIADTGLRAYNVARALNLAGWYIGNEPNLLGRLSIGANVPPVQSDKGPAMAPEVFYSFAHECAGWLRRAGAGRVIVGSLSWLPSAGDDDANNYCAAYLNAGLAYLRETGVTEHRWDATGVNCEGVWTLARAQAMRAEITRITDRYGFQMPLSIGECGWQNGNGVDAALAAQTDQALAAVSCERHLFSYNAAQPDNARGYGCRLWRIVDGGFVPAFAPLPWYGVVQSLYTGQA